MSQVPSMQILSLKGHFDFEKLCQHQKVKIPLNIKMGKMAMKMLSEVSQKMLNQAIDQLVVEYQNQHNDILNTDEKRNHVLNTLDRIKHGKWNFVDRNIEQANKFNEYYKQKIIDDIGMIDKEFKCDYCGKRAFKLKAALSSHQRTCVFFLKREQNLGSYSFKKVKTQQIKQFLPTRNVKVEIIRHQQNKMQMNHEQKRQNQDLNKFKRQAYQISFDSIFEDE